MGSSSWLSKPRRRRWWRPSVSQRASFSTTGSWILVSSTGPEASSISTTSVSLARILGEVDMLMGRICRELHARGLLTHELCWATRCCDVLGIELDGERLRTRAASTTYEKLRLTLQWILGKKRISGQTAGACHGTRDLHITGAATALVSVCGRVQVPTGPHHHEPTFLWASCRSELQHFLGAMPATGK